MKILTVAFLIGALGYSAGVTLEDHTHALHVSRITGTPYLKVLGAWERLQASDMTDTDCDKFDEEVRLEGDQS